jgi:DNA-binding NarL/FixJ family response regulator
VRSIRLSPDCARIAVAVVDDHPLYRDALVSVLMGSEQVSSVLVAGTVEEYEGIVGPVEPDVVLLDLGLPGVSGAAAVGRLVDRGRPVLVISAQSDDARILDALAAGAAGFLSKTADGPDLLAGTFAVASGQRWVAPHLAGRLLGVDAGRPRLSQREREVLSHVASGYTDHEIAARLHITVTTVRSHMDRIRDKTGRRRRVELVRYALEG